jgi:hypothetical protein
MVNASKPARRRMVGKLGYMVSYGRLGRKPGLWREVASTVDKTDGERIKSNQEEATILEEIRTC